MIDLLSSSSGFRNVSNIISGLLSVELMDGVRDNGSNLVSVFVSAPTFQMLLIWQMANDDWPKDDWQMAIGQGRLTIDD